MLRDVVRQKNGQCICSVRPGILRRHSVNLNLAGNDVQTHPDFHFLQNLFHNGACNRYFLFAVLAKVGGGIFVRRHIGGVFLNGVVKKGTCAVPYGFQFIIFKRRVTAVSSFMKAVFRLLCITVFLQYPCGIAGKGAVSLPLADNVRQCVQLVHEYV